MFREMRRKRQLLSEEECAAILESGSSGTLAVLGDDAYPYAVPLSYVYADGILYFHSAQSGHKVDAVQSHDKASFCVIQMDQVIPEEYTTCFRSAIAFGRIRILKDVTEKRAAIERLAAKYAPDDSAENRKAAIERDWKPLCMMEMKIEHMTGKEAIELVRARAQTKDGGSL